MTRTRVCCDDGMPVTRFENETFTVDHAGQTVVVEGLSGWRCDACAEVGFDPDGARRYAEAGDALVLAERARRHGTYGAYAASWGSARRRRRG